jgi:hypothetical protein
MRRAVGLKISAARIKRGISAGLLKGSMGVPNTYKSKRKPIKGKSNQIAILSCQIAKPTCP